MENCIQDLPFDALHALCPGSLGGHGRTLSPAMELALQANFGSLARWREAFLAMGNAHAGRPGWVLLTFQPRDGTLTNQWAADHTQVLGGSVPILALSMVEHANDMDSGAAANHVDAFMDKLDWEAVHQRYQRVVDGASETCGAGQDEVAGAIVLDVRRAAVFRNAPTRLVGASWHDPALVATWGATVPPDRDVVVYCVYGHEVSRAIALRLRAMGLRARYLRGGIDAWQAAGRAVEPQPAAS